MDYDHLKCITPIDGRYKSKTGNLEQYFSEMSFNKYRLYIEIEYLISLGEFKLFDVNEDMSQFLRDIYNKFSFDECIKMKKIEEEINHIDLCQDIWLYISRNILIQKVNKKEVGSSTMPHKINPINFENTEGNFLLANSLLEFFSRKLPISKMQRDLTDSTILRNVGSAFSFSH